MIAVDIPVIGMDQNVAVWDNIRPPKLLPDQSETSGCPERFVFFHITDRIISGQIGKIRSDHTLPVIHGDIKISDPEVIKPVDNALHNRNIADRDQGLGENFGVWI